jgi:hypothetical protein
VSDYGVVLFYTTSSVMAADKILAAKGYAFKLVPTPRQFSTDCGISLRFLWENHQDIKDMLEKEKIEYEEIWQL